MHRGICFVTVAIGFTALATFTAAVPAARADVRPHAGMLRFPDVSATQIVFVYANDLWLAPRAGGVAIPLASPPGPELFPRFSPDGKTIAFVGNYDGNRDLYTISVDGGVATRVTYHPSAETLNDWTPDGRLIFATSGYAGLARQQQLFTIAATGGLPEKLPVPYGTSGAIAKLADGRNMLAYTPHSTDFRTWKRYRGGMATDVWVFDLNQKSSQRITDWEGTDTLPMWHRDVVYYLSDNGPEHRLNIWSYQLADNKRVQVTNFTEWDVKFPSVGPGPTGDGEIVFQNGSDLYLLDLKSGQSKTVEITIPGDRPTIRNHTVDASKTIATGDLSPTGKRAVFEARGDIWTVPAQKGSPYNLTRTSNAAERMPAWSPDGQWIAYFSDEFGEYQLYARQSDGKGEVRQLTNEGTTFRYSPTWSPDSKRIAYTDKAGNIFLHTIESKTTTLIDTDPWSGQPRIDWSQDSNWFTYPRGCPNRLAAIWLYDVKDDKKHQVTSGRFQDTWPTFDRKGDYLYFASNRNFTDPIYEDLGTTFVYANTDTLLVVPLRKDVASPFAAKSDEEDWKKSEAEKAAETQPASASQPTSDAVEKKDDKKPVIIDVEGFEARAVNVPLKKGAFSNLMVNHEGKLLYVRGAPRGVEGSPSIKLFDPNDEKREEKTVLDGVGNFAYSADGKKLLVNKDGKHAVVDAAPDQKMEKPISLAGMTATIDPRAEWRQIFNEAWRIQRDFFYDPHMHGVDWAKMRLHYGKMLDDCVAREDVNFVIAEMISELNVGHAYVLGPGDVQEQPSVSCGMLGADLELTGGAFRIKRIYTGGPWDADARGPLSQPGVSVKEGDYLLAVNRVPLDTAKDPWAAFQGMAGRVVTLTVCDSALPWAEASKVPTSLPATGGPTATAPAGSPDVREVIVELPAGEGNLRYRAWIERNRAYVSDKTGGRVGYIYVPNTGVDGQNDLVRQFYGQIDKEALIIDERWNGGGQIPTRFIELLNRPVTNYWAVRDGTDWTWPPDSHQGPKCMLINGLAGSGGDAFPAYFKMMKVGKLIGTRTWGGLVGISGNPGFIDGGGTSAPTFAYYERDGTWGIEGHGVDPDIVVIDDPAKMQDGADPQLDTAIGLMLEEMAKNPYVAPKRPAYPNRSKMGIRDEDK